MTTYWDTLMWETEVSSEENEVRVSIEGRISDVDDQMLRKIQGNDVVIDNVKLVPTDDPEATHRTGGNNHR